MWFFLFLYCNFWVRLFAVSLLLCVWPRPPPLLLVRAQPLLCIYILYAEITLPRNQCCILVCYLFSRMTFHVIGRDTPVGVV